MLLFAIVAGIARPGVEVVSSTVGYIYKAGPEPMDRLREFVTTLYPIHNLMKGGKEPRYELFLLYPSL